MLIDVIVCFLLGLIFGSFFQVIGIRVPLGKPIAWSRSACPVCKTTLQAHDLVPVFSFLFRLGKCRYCAARIPLQYVCVELFTAALFVLVYCFHYPLSIEALTAFLVLSLVVIVTITDLYYMRIPNTILLFFASILVLIRLFIDPFDPWWHPFLAAVLSFCVLYCIMIISAGGIGGGDIKLFAVLALAFGFWDVFLIFFLSTLFGTLTGIVARISGHLQTGQAFPFAPSIALAAIIVLLFGDWIWALYPHLSWNDLSESC